MKDSRLKIDELQVDDLLIDEIVSGQLTGERYRSALRALDADPSKWRDCALAFLEDQALRNDLRKLAQGTIDWSARSAVDGTTSLQETPQPMASAKVTSSLSRRPSSVSFRGALSTAALLLISFTVGWLGSEVWVEHQQSSATTGTRSIGDQASKVQPSPSRTLEPQFVVDGPGAFHRGIPSSIRELERDGKISVKTFDILVPTTLDDGSSAFVPVQQMILGRGRVESY